MHPFLQVHLFQKSDIYFLSFKPIELNIVFGITIY